MGVCAEPHADGSDFFVGLEELVIAKFAKAPIQ